MKKLFLVFSVFVIASAAKQSHAQTNVYHPFPDSAATWNIHFGWYCFMNGTGDENYSITISGDTLISSQTYHKLTTPYVESFSTGTCGGISTGYKGAIREDTLNRKVFFIPPTDTTEQLLYDFTMQVGDTVKGYIETFNVDIVQSIDSVLVGNNYRKRWSINPSYQIDFIEGIGSTYGLIEFSPGFTDAAFFSITCFQQNGQTLYPDTITNCQLIMTSVNSIESYSTLANISPNPFSTRTTVQITSSELRSTSYELEMYDVFGRMVKEFAIRSSPFVIERGNLPSGIYFIQLEEEGKPVAAGKLVITND